MKRFFNFLKAPPITLAIAAILAYGILIPQLGFYWDDLPIGWIRYQLGSRALTDYFSTNRPALGILYQSLTALLPYKPLFWQLLALLLRWGSSLLLWLILRQLFPRKASLPLTAALLFLLYPAFNQQFVAFVYSSHFTALFFFLFSIYAMLRGWTVPALLASALNLLLGEYFFLLDLIRYPIFWISLSPPRGKETLRRVVSACYPYLIVFLAMIVGRVYLLPNQTYEYNLFAALQESPAATLFGLLKTVLLSLWTTLIAAWGQAFLLPDFTLQGKVTITIYLGVILLTFGAVIYSAIQKAPAAVPGGGESDTPTEKSRDNLLLIALGIFAVLLAGVPFWLTNLPVSLGFPANRATLPFSIGSVFVLVGLISLISRKELRITFFALLIAFSAGRQFLWADEFRRDWRVQQNLFWQLSWRVPALEEDTAILLNEGALKFYADNSLSAPLNWIYAPKTDAENIPYMLFYPRTRFGVDGEKLEENLPLAHDFIAGEFNGNSDRMLLINFDPPGCLHIVDPILDENNKFIADLLLRNAASFSRPALIVTEGEPVLPAIYGDEPNHGWCYYFQKADLARQRGDWVQATRLGDQALNAGDHPNDPTEYLPFIEAYAHTGDWTQAEQLSLRAYRISKSYMRPLLCPLWERIGKTTLEDSQKDVIIEKMQEQLNCEP